MERPTTPPPDSQTKTTIVLTPTPLASTSRTSYFSPRWIPGGGGSYRDRDRTVSNGSQSYFGSMIGSPHHHHQAGEQDRGLRQSFAESEGGIQSPWLVLEAVMGPRTSGEWTSSTSTSGGGGIGASLRERSGQSRMSMSRSESGSVRRLREDSVESGGGSHITLRGREPLLVVQENRHDTSPYEGGGRPLTTTPSYSSRHTHTSNSPPSFPERERPPSSSRRLLALFYPLSLTQKNVLKCVLAYFIAELFTFVPVLANIVGAPFDKDGPVRNAHVIATVAVYFNPGKTVGGMIESDLFMLVAVVYTMFLCCGSMSMTVTLDEMGYEKLAHAIVLIFWVGVGFGALAFVKVKANKPTITTACGLVSLFVSVIITKEGAYHIGTFQSEAIVQIMIIAAIGILISNVVCFTIWRGSATEKFENDLEQTLDSFGTLLGLLTKTFLMDDDISTRPSDLLHAISLHQSSFTSLQTSLTQAKFEFLNHRIYRTSHLYDSATISMTRLAQGLTGLRSGCMLQYELMSGAEGEDGEEKFESEVEILELFKEQVGNSLQQLSSSARDALSTLKHSSKGGSNDFSIADLETSSLSTSEALLVLKNGLKRDLALFNTCHSNAIKELYQRDSGVENIVSEEDEGPSDNLFRMYYFCFNYEEWVRELCSLMDTFIEIRLDEEEYDLRMAALSKKWGIFAPVARMFRWTKNDHAADREMTKQSSETTPFPPIVDGALSSHQIPASQLSTLGRIKQSFWKLGWELRQPYPRFAIKTGFGACLMAMFAFLPETRGLWLEYRGEWALISYMVVMAPTLGQTNYLAFGRLLGTFFGAGIALGFYLAFPEDPIALPILGALFSIPCFWVIVTKPKHAPTGRFVLLTYNLTCLYAYNLREVDTHIVSIAYHRSLAVGFGVVWGLFVTNYIWPFEARRELRKGLSDFLLNSAYLYERLVRTYSNPPTDKSRPASSFTGATERSLLLDPGIKSQRKANVNDFIEMELYLQLSLIRLGELLAATKHEPRLKGPFPTENYRRVMTNCQNILDLLTSMRTITNKDVWFTQVRKDFVAPVNRERREMVGNVLLYFSVLSSALSLKTPLPAYLPPAANAREQLVYKLRQLPIVKQRIVRGGSEGLLYLAYALAMKDVITQLEDLGSTFQVLFGIVGGATSTADFEALFITREE